jgi:hypothetical protein
MRLYHRTSTEAAEAILSGGFRDGWSGGIEFSSAPYPIDQIPPIKRAVLLAITVPDAIAQTYAWQFEDREKPTSPEGAQRYQEFLVPAEIVNRHGPPVIVTEANQGS